MSLKVKEPSNFEEAVYLLDRNRLPDSVKVRRHSREAAINDLMDMFDENEDKSDDYSEWKVDDLKEELERRGLDTDGKKADLVERLEESDEDELMS